MEKRDIKSMILDLFNVFEISKELEVSVVTDAYKEEVIYSPKNNHVYFYLMSEDITDTALNELVARLKVGIEYHPLLTTLYFEKPNTEREKFAIEQFYYLVVPLIDVWAWKEMLKYLPMERVEKRFDEIRNKAEILELYRMMGFSVGNLDRFRMSISGHLISKILLGYDSNLKIVSKNRSAIEEWNEYISELENLSYETPNINLLINFAQKYLPDLEITVKSDVISIKEKKTNEKRIISNYFSLN